ncbi:hypothetical protein GCM10010201_11440 [Pilimelia columellifera subsp. columellifera]|uniref:Uncharacterized protein n=1 Tax=Pilimelia columellifera subsp. columellifera TaxID=706583 RepID=A0ABN3N8B9_9ACTN
MATLTAGGAGATHSERLAPGPNMKHSDLPGRNGDPEPASDPSQAAACTWGGTRWGNRVLASGFPLARMVRR